MKRVINFVLCVFIGHFCALSQPVVQHLIPQKNKRSAALQSMDSLRHLLSGINWAIAQNPANQILLRKPPIHTKKTTGTSNECGYFCQTVCTTVFDSAKALLSPLCPGATTSLVAYGAIGLNRQIKWWTGTNGTGTLLGRGDTLKNAGIGVYYARLTADCGEVLEKRVEVLQAVNNMTSSFTKTNATCFGLANGTATITINGGTPPYLYKIGSSGVYQSSNVFSGLKAGSYRIYYQDARGCTGFTSYIPISQYPKITSTFTKTNATCYGTATGSLTVTAANGLPPYSYRLGTTGSFGTANTFSNLKAGSYVVYILDSIGCQVSSGSIAIGQPVAVSATYSATSATCYGTATASLTVNGTNGVAPYLYRLGTTGVFSSTNVFNNIKGATYKVNIQDANGCIGSISAVVPQPAAITLSFSKTAIGCTSLGSITIIKTGGPSKPPYQYKLNTTVYGSNSTFIVAKAGNYYGYIKDSLGCLANTLVIAMPAPTGCRGEIAKGVTGENSKTSFLKVILSPNPSSDNFTLIAHSNSAKPVYIRVLDVEGRMVYSEKGMTDQSFVFGEKLGNGVYTIEVRQGDEIKTVKGVKIK